MQGELAGLDRDQGRAGVDVPAGAPAALEGDVHGGDVDRPAGGQLDAGDTDMAGPGDGAASQQLATTPQGGVAVARSRGSMTRAATSARARVATAAAKRSGRWVSWCMAPPCELPRRNLGNAQTDPTGQEVNFEGCALANGLRPIHPPKARRRSLRPARVTDPSASAWAMPTWPRYTWVKARTSVVT
jgi:hypothetical protein